MKSECVFLLIEDNLIDQLITTKLLKKTLGIVEVNVVNNGKEGIEWLRNHKNKLNELLIILLDIKMPEMDGFEFLEQFDEISEDVKQNIEIFMLSSTMDRTDIKRAKDNTYVKTLFSKPLPVKEFKNMIQVEHW